MPSIMPLASVDDLVNGFISKVMTNMDSVASIRSKVLPGKKKAPWRNAVLREEKKKDYADRQSKSKLQVHYSIYKESCHVYNQELKNARQSFFNHSHSDPSNPHILFSVVDRPTNQWTPVLPELLSNKSWYDKFFHRKTIKDKTNKNVVSTNEFSRLSGIF